MTRSAHRRTRPARTGASASLARAERRRRGYSMVEVAVATGVLGLVAAAGLQVVGLNAKRAAAAEEERLGHKLAEALLGEILAMPFDDPVDGPGMGVEAGETVGNRTTFDDLDDFNNYMEIPLTDADGVALDIPGVWMRIVAITPLDRWTLATSSDKTAPVVRVKVLVYSTSRLVAESWAYRTRAGDAFLDGSLAEQADDAGVVDSKGVDDSRWLQSVDDALAGVHP